MSRQHFYSIRVVQLWNALPDYIVNAPSLNIFRNTLNLDKSLLTFLKGRALDGL